MTEPPTVALNNRVKHRRSFGLVSELGDRERMQHSTLFSNV